MFTAAVGPLVAAFYRACQFPEFPDGFAYFTDLVFLLLLPPLPQPLMLQLSVEFLLRLCQQLMICGRPHTTHQVAPLLPLPTHRFHDDQFGATRFRVAICPLYSIPRTTGNGPLPHGADYLLFDHYNQLHRLLANLSTFVVYIWAPNHGHVIPVGMIISLCISPEHGGILFVIFLWPAAIRPRCVSYRQHAACWQLVAALVSHAAMKQS